MSEGGGVVLEQCISARNIKYCCNPHVRTDVPHLFIFRYHKYHLLSIVKLFFICIVWVLNRMFSFYEFFLNRMFSFYEFFSK